LKIQFESNDMAQKKCLQETVVTLFSCCWIFFECRFFVVGIDLFESFQRSRAFDFEEGRYGVVF
jgi:hypothetical protein